MSELTDIKPKGALRKGWSGLVDDYAIACEWALGGDIALVGDVLGGVRAFDGKSGKIIWHLTDIHDGALLTMRVHPDGALFATAGQDGYVVLWDCRDGKQVAGSRLGSGWVEHLSWSDSGSWLAATCSRDVFVMDVECAEVWRSKDHPSTVSAIAWARDDEIAVACYGRVTFYDVVNGDLSQKLEWRGSLVSMILSPDGDIVACGSQDNSVHFWRRSTGQDSMMSGYPGKPSNLAFDSSGTLLATGGAETVTVWSFEGDGPEGTSPGHLELHTKPISSLAFAPRANRLASGARDGSVVAWALKSDGQGGPIGAALMTDRVSAVSWRPDGRALAAVDGQGGVCAWRVS